MSAPQRRGKATLSTVLLFCASAVHAHAQEPPPEPVELQLEWPATPAEPPAPPDEEPLALPPEPQPPPPRPTTSADVITLRAERVVYDPNEHALRAEGGVLVLAPDRSVAASAATLNLRTGVLHAAGPIIMAEANQVVTCQSADLDLKTQSGVMRQVRTESRAPMDKATRDAVARLGRAPPGARSSITTGETVTLLGPNELRIQNAYVTTCDCKTGSAPWSVRAERANVVVGRYALVWSPRVHIYDVPVALLPLWVVPLSARQSGLLFPEIRFQDGLWITQPAYLTLGDSADVTVGPGFVLERGPRLQLELRAAPNEDTYAELDVMYQHDRKHVAQRRAGPAYEIPLGVEVPAEVEQRLALRGGRTATGEYLWPDRFASRLLVTSTLAGVSLAADMNQASDKYVPGDFGASLGDRVAPYLRSAAAISHGKGSVYFSAALVTFQDLQQPEVALFGDRSAMLAHRMPSLRLRLVEVPLLSVPHLGTLVAGRAQLGMDQEWLLGAPDAPGQERTREDFTQPGRQAGSVRVFMEPHLVAPLRLGRFGGFRAGMAVREAVFFSPTQGAADVTRLLAYANAETEVTGRFTARGMGGLTHKLRPSVGYQGVWWARRSGGAWPWMDESDRTGRYHAVGAGLWNELAAGRLLGRRATLTTEIRASQDIMDLSRRELYGRWQMVAGDAGASFRLAVDPVLREVTFAQTGFDLGGGDRPQVHMGYTRVGPRPPRFMLAGGEELLGGLRLDGPIRDGGSDRLDMLLRVPLGQAWVDYGFEAAFPGLDLSLDQALPRQPRDARPVLLTHGGGVAYESACRCWGVAARVRWWPDRTGWQRYFPDAAVQVNLSGPAGAVKLF
ncbi:MAG: hypothetical protein AB2A00_35275 [Myxococcota bacterium]